MQARTAGLSKTAVSANLARIKLAFEQTRDVTLQCLKGLASMSLPFVAVLPGRFAFQRYLAGRVWPGTTSMAMSVVLVGHMRVRMARRCVAVPMAVCGRRQRIVVVVGVMPVVVAVRVFVL